MDAEAPNVHRFGIGVSFFGVGQVDERNRISYRVILQLVPKVLPAENIA